MAGMRLFGRRCYLATDDFLFIGLIHFIIYLPWLAWIPVIYTSFLKQRTSCDEDILLDISLPGLCVLFFLNWFISALFIFFSIQGTIAKPEPRRHVATLVYIKLFIFILDIAWASLGTVILFRNNYCDIIGVGLLIKVCTIFQWVATIIRLAMAIIFYDWNFSKNTKESVTKEYFTHSIRRGTFKKWSFRVQAFFLLCTTPSDERKQALKTASELLALLSCDLDLVVSDMLAGLIVIRQRARRLWKQEDEAFEELHPITSADGVKFDHFPPDNLEPWMNLQSAHHFFNLGMGVFGWFWFVFKHFSCGCCMLFKRLTCCFPFRKKSSIVEGDNCCGCDVAGLQLTTGFVYEDLVLVSFKDSVYEIPYFVAFDHESSSILLSARGTMSLNDVLTDVTGTFTPMDDPGLPPGGVCHEGMLTAARQIKKKLDEKGILEEAFRERPEYQLVLTGHSLGASVATILTVLYKHQYSNVRCYAFAPAPTINKVLLPYVQKNVFTLIFGNDTCNAMSYESIKNVILEIVDVLENCNLPKYKILLCHKDPGDVEQPVNRQYDTFVRNGAAKTSNGTTFDHSNENGSRTSQPVTLESSYLAGAILHIYPRKDGYRFKINNPECYRKLMFRPKCLLDHVPIYIEKALEDLSQKEILDASFIKNCKKKVT